MEKEKEKEKEREREREKMLDLKWSERKIVRDLQPS